MLRTKLFFFSFFVEKLINCNESIADKKIRFLFSSKNRNPLKREKKHIK